MKQIFIDGLKSTLVFLYGWIFGIASGVYLLIITYRWVSILFAVCATFSVYVIGYVMGRNDKGTE